MISRTAILQSNYIPWKGYFDLINSVDEFIIYDDMQYTKNDWRNRNKIKGSNGLQWLTIPVKHITLQQRISDTKVSDRLWNEKHWKTIKNTYARAPFFKEYSHFFESIYLSLETEYLSEINYAFITAICKIIGIKTNITWSSEYDFGEGKSERLLRLVQATNGTEYVSGPAAKAYLDKELFNQAGIKVSWMDYSNYKTYKQLYPPFEHGVSIIDLIFNEGPMASTFLRSFQRSEEVLS